MGLHARWKEYTFAKCSSLPALDVWLCKLIEFLEHFPRYFLFMHLLLCKVYANGNIWTQILLGKSGIWEVHKQPGELICRTKFPKDRFSSAVCQESVPIPDFVDKHNFLCCCGCQREFVMSGHVLSAFVTMIKHSRTYRRLILSSYYKVADPSVCELDQRELIIHVVPCRQYVDYAWGERVERMVLVKMELGNTMSWLSTFGGAFSALGEELKDFALVAGRISIKQLTIAIRLGDPVLAARCKLYLALSLIQQGQLSRARHIIREQYEIVKHMPVLDKSVVRMCQGIWAKLKYSYQLRRELRMSGKSAVSKCSRSVNK